MSETLLCFCKAIDAAVAAGKDGLVFRRQLCLQSLIDKFSKTTFDDLELIARSVRRTLAETRQPSRITEFVDAHVAAGHKTVVQCIDDGKIRAVCSCGGSIVDGDEAEAQESTGAR